MLKKAGMTKYSKDSSQRTYLSTSLIPIHQSSRYNFKHIFKLNCPEQDIRIPILSKVLLKISTTKNLHYYNFCKFLFKTGDKRGGRE